MRGGGGEGIVSLKRDRAGKRGKEEWREQRWGKKGWLGGGGKIYVSEMTQLFSSFNTKQAGLHAESCPTIVIQSWNETKTRRLNGYCKTNQSEYTINELIARFSGSS